MSAFDPKRTSPHCSTFAPITRLVGAFIASATELIIWSEPNASWRVLVPRTHRCGRIHLSPRDSHHEALPKIRSRYGLARTSRAYTEG